MTFETAAIRRAATRFDHTRFIDELRNLVGVREAPATRACDQSQSGERTDPALARTERGIE